MLLEVAKPIALCLCLLSLYTVFHAALLAPEDLEQRVWNSVELMSLAAGICVVSGLIFREWESGHGVSPPLASTLPVQLFCWAAGLIVGMFLASWYLETHVIPHRDLRRL